MVFTRSHPLNHGLLSYHYYRLVWNRRDVGGWEKWTAEQRDGNKIALKSHKGRYLCLENNGHFVANREHASGWDLFEFQLGVGGYTKIWSPDHHKFVCATDSKFNAHSSWRLQSIEIISFLGGNMEVRDSASAWETFKVEYH